MIGSIAVAALLANTGITAEIPLWPGTAPGSENAPAIEKTVTDSEGYRIVSSIAKPALLAFPAPHPNGTAIIVAPGSGFRAEALDREGTEVARWLNRLGVDAYVLKYRLPSEGHSHGEDVVVQDAQRAIRLVRAQNEHRRVGIMGFSAGGNLTAISAAYHDRMIYAPRDAADRLSARPDFFAVAYGYVPRQEDLSLVQMPPGSQTYRYLEKYPFEPAVTAAMPPCFVLHGTADSHVPASHSGRIKAAADKAGVACEIHLIEGAGHGFGLGRTDKERAWQPLFETWLTRLP